MIKPQDLVPIYTIFNVAIMSFAYDTQPKDTYGFIMVLSFSALSIRTWSNQELVIVYLGNRCPHFIWLDFMFGLPMSTIVFLCVTSQANLSS